MSIAKDKQGALPLLRTEVLPVPLTIGRDRSLIAPTDSPWGQARAF